VKGPALTVYMGTRLHYRTSTPARLLGNRASVNSQLLECIYCKVLQSTRVILFIRLIVMLRCVNVETCKLIVKNNGANGALHDGTLFGRLQRINEYKAHSGLSSNSGRL
jgi:hypothetical protein